jgi:hypothetical protein
MFSFTFRPEVLKSLKSLVLPVLSSGDNVMM